MFNLSYDSIDIIKLGGSIITDKTEYKKLRSIELKNICQQIKEWGKPSIIVHGAGSYGHIKAKDFQIKSGFSEIEQIHGLIQIRKDMHELSSIIVEELSALNLNAMAFQTSALTLEEDESLYDYFLEPIKLALKINILPVLSGDIIFSKKQMFDIISGDVLIELLVKNFKINRVMFVTDVDGIFYLNPKTKESDYIREISSEDLKDLAFESIQMEETVDVTGTMKGKVESILSILKSVNEVVIVNGRPTNRVLDVLNNKTVKCTKIR